MCWQSFIECQTQIKNSNTGVTDNFFTKSDGGNGKEIGSKSSEGN